jgi:hypothetical protein
MKHALQKTILLLFLVSCSWPTNALGLLQLNPVADGENVFQAAVSVNGKSYRLNDLPILSYLLNGKLKSTSSGKSIQQADSIIITDGNLQISYRSVPGSAGTKARVIFKNISTRDTLHIENIVPFGEASTHVYITGKGDHGLSRSHLFRPGFEPVNVILPDNAWELGFSAITLDDNEGICALARRTAWDKTKAQRRRFETLLYPGGTVTYTLWADLYSGNWQEGLRQIFQDRLLYDISGTFDNSLFEREDLKWIRHTYAMHLMMNWDHQYYDAKDGAFHMEEFLQKGKKLYGGDDVIGIWPNWPMLGLDQRNQWDLYRALPGGTAKIKELAEHCRSNGTKLFISYNP